MEKGRLTAFSDGVIAIIITIMVLELKVPHGDDLAALRPLNPLFLSYILSFINLGIYWNNHHHLFQVVQYVSGRVLWANLHLLFWLSLIPFVTAWMGENYFTALPVAFYGGVLLFSAIAYLILTMTLIVHHGQGSMIATAIGRDFKGKLSVVIYAISILLAFANSWLAFSLYVLVAMIWLIPDRPDNGFLGAAGVRLGNPRRAIVDGIFGAVTASAVRDLQQRHRIPVTGRVNPTTWEVLDMHENPYRSPLPWKQ